MWDGKEEKVWVGFIQDKAHRCYQCHAAGTRLDRPWLDATVAETVVRGNFGQHSTLVYLSNCIE